MADRQIIRDHEDIDIAIPDTEAEAVWDYMQDKKLSLWTHENEQITSLEELKKTPDNEGLVVKPLDLNPVFPTFEIMFIRTDTQTGNIKGPSGVDLTSESFADCPTVSLVNGIEVTLEPREFILLHKLLDGRHKDYVDIRTHLPKLSVQERVRLATFIEEAQIEFKIGDQTITDIDELLLVAEKKSPELFNESVEAIIEEETTAAAEQLFGVARQILECKR